MSICNTNKASKDSRVKNKVSVMFVGGYGRSGSTVLDMLLGRVPGVVTVGEFRHLFGRAMGDNELCSCSKPFNECPFWNEVIKMAFPKGVDRESLHKIMTRINRVVATPYLQYQCLRSKAMQYELDIYNEAFSKAYEAIAQITGAKVIIDSSKYPLHGLALEKSPEIDLKVMLLVRDPRAVAYSWERYRIRPEVHWEKKEMPRHNVVRSALAWNASNYLTKLLDNERLPFRIQKYEDLIQEPLEVLNEIASFALGVQSSIGDEIFESSLTLSDHTIAGNPIRLNNRKFQIKPDIQWITNMQPVKKKIVSLICMKQMIKYGYTY